MCRLEAVSPKKMAGNPMPSLTGSEQITIYRQIISARIPDEGSQCTQLLWLVIPMGEYGHVD
jgi:hypothetical protein